MNLISCDHCGVVLDLSKISFPFTIYNEDGVDDSLGTYSKAKKEWVAYITCPVCKEKIEEQ